MWQGGLTVQHQRLQRLRRQAAAARPWQDPWQLFEFLLVPLELQQCCAPLLLTLGG